MNKKLKGNGTNDNSPLAGYLGGNNTPAYAMLPNRGVPGLKLKKTKATDTSSRGYLAGYMGGPSGSSYAMKPNSGKTKVKKGDGMAAALEGFHAKRGR